MSVETMVGKQVGNYIISELIGSGGMGSVYLARHPQIGRRVAIKLLSEEMSARPGFADRFIAEAKAVTRIEHPNVIDIYDFGQTDDGQLYCVMELLKGRELTEIIQGQAPMTAADVLPYVEQICASLVAAHDSGVVHRDLKPENIFVLDREPMALKILDFGIAKLLEKDSEDMGSRTATGIVMGTPLTIAPEQAAGQPDQIGPHTDLYSLGVIIFWMLAGRPPFRDARTAVLLAQHITATPPSLAELAPATPQTIVELVHACLAKDPKDRPPSASAIADAFRAGLAADDRALVEATLPPHDAPAPATEQPIPKTRRMEPPSKTTTTMQGSAGEMADREPDEALPRSSRSRLVALAVGLAVVVVIAFVLVQRSGDGPPGPMVKPVEMPPRRAATPAKAASPQVAAPEPAAPDGSLDALRSATATAPGTKAAQEKQEKKNAAQEARERAHKKAGTKAARDRLAREKAIRNATAREMAARTMAREMAAKEKAAKEKAAKEKAAKEKAAKEKAAKEKAAKEMPPSKLGVGAVEDI